VGMTKRPTADTLKSTFTILMNVTSKIKRFTLLLILLSALDFTLNTIFIPSITTDLFTTVIFVMGQMVTILLQFFSWFFMLTALSEFRQGGYAHLFINFWHLFATTAVYILLFLINKVMLLAAVGARTDLDFYDFWDNRTVVTLWSLQRLAAVVHYAFSIYYILRIFSDAKNFV
jgi:hypothetical protein